MYQARNLTLNSLENGYVELVIDAADAAVNTLNAELLSDLTTAVALLEKQTDIKGLLIRSAKSNFVVGANIMELIALQDQPAAAIAAVIRPTHQLFNAIENLPFPTLSLINGLALGGGMELALATDYRFATPEAAVGLPEVHLGLCPGWGGNIRLSRLIGEQPALAWILSGKHNKAAAALEVGAIDRIVDSEEALSAALKQLAAAAADGSFQTQRNRKQQASGQAAEQIRSSALANHARLIDSNTPVAETVIDLIAQTATQTYADALEAEINSFCTLLRSDAAKALAGLFVSDQFIKKQAKKFTQAGNKVAKGAVLGAGVMGGGIAYQSSSSGIAVELKDINDAALQLGMDTAAALLDRQLAKGKIDAAGKQAVLDGIHPTLNYDNFDQVDMLVEAVVENPAIKASVLAEVEQHLPEDAVVSSNTSTISITQLAGSLQRPEKFCGMHFFNPVHLMPLVEVIRGEKTDDATLARAVNYALAMKKKPIVVNDCPGFLVNRILFPYFNAFNLLLLDGADFEQIDRVMEAFGWPMGPAYLADVVGIDVLVHADHVLQEGFPERMKHQGAVIAEMLLERGELGQKSGRGFYTYGKDASGKRVREVSESTRQLIAQHAGASREFSETEIIERLMIPLCMEAVRCLEDQIVSSAAEVDMGLILGLGFPKFRGGALRYIDLVGLENFAESIERYADLGPLYQTTPSFSERVKTGQKFY